MQYQEKLSLKESVIKQLLLCLKITLVVAFFFVFIFKQYTLKGIAVTFLISFMYSFVLGFGQGFLNIFLSSKFDWITQTNKRLYWGIGLAILYTIPAVLLVNYVLFVEIKGLDATLFFKGQYFWIHLFYILISFFVSSLLHARGFMLELKKTTRQQQKEQEFMTKNETAKLETLKSQIDPHFLFNSLNVLTSLIVENPIQAERFTTKLAKVYRYVLEQRDKNIIPLSEELQFARTFIDLLGIRFEDAITFEVEKSLLEATFKIVPLSLQLLLENAVKHNVVSATNPLRIKIYHKDEFLIIENNNNPKQILEQKSTKFGLQSIKERYGLLSDEKVKITKTESLFTVHLPLL